MGARGAGRAAKSFEMVPKARGKDGCLGSLGGGAFYEKFCDGRARGLVGGYQNVATPLAGNGHTNQARLRWGWFSGSAQLLA